MPEGFIPSHGGYKQLLSYRKAEIVYDATVKFCKDLMEKRDRTYDQMIQAARSGKQNIVEGSLASGGSKEMEFKLTQVARASLEELLEDYRDFLRARGFAEWPKEHAYTRRLRELNHQSDFTYATFQAAIEHADPAIRANAIIGMIKVTSFLLDQQTRHLEKMFLKQGGLRERMTQARIEHRNHARR